MIQKREIVGKSDYHFLFWNTAFKGSIHRSATAWHWFIARILEHRISRNSTTHSSIANWWKAPGQHNWSEWKHWAGAGNDTLIRGAISFYRSPLSWIWKVARINQQMQAGCFLFMFFTYFFLPFYYFSKIIHGNYEHSNWECDHTIRWF